MPLKDILVILIPVLLTLSGWIVVHMLSRKREIEQKKREIRVKYLREAYLKLATVADRGSLQQNLHDIQDAFNDIQILGEESQIELIGKFIEEVNSGKSPAINELLKQLRNEIREHIGLEALDDYRWYIRIDEQDERI